MGQSRRDQSLSLTLPAEENVVDPDFVARTAETRPASMFPTFSADAIQFLVEARGVIALGTDSPEISRHADANAYAAAHGLYALTNIAGLGTAPEAGGAAIVAPPRRTGATEAEARVLALVR